MRSDSEAFSVSLQWGPVKLNRDVALRALWPNSLFQLVLSQNNPLVLIGFYQNLYHHEPNAKFSISHRFFEWKICRMPVRQCFLVDKSWRKMHTSFYAGLRQQRKSDVFWSLHSQRRLLWSMYPIVTKSIAFIIHTKYFLVIKQKVIQRVV
jgi:hypothetical protein